jgi:hypothetical protein
MKPPADPSHEEKLAWVREAAGERFARLELRRAPYSLVITDGPHAPRDEAPLPRRPMTTARAVEQMLAQRERYGITNVQVYSPTQMEYFAPVLARLAGA